MSTRSWRLHNQNVKHVVEQQGGRFYASDPSQAQGNSGRSTRARRRCRGREPPTRVFPPPITPCLPPTRPHSRPVCLISGYEGHRSADTPDAKGPYSHVLLYSIPTFECLSSCRSFSWVLKASGNQQRWIGTYLRSQQVCNAVNWKEQATTMHRQYNGWRLYETTVVLIVPHPLAHARIPYTLNFSRHDREAGSANTYAPAGALYALYAQG